MKESFDTADENKVLQVGPGLDSNSVDMAAAMIAPHDETSNLFTPRSRSFGAWGSPSFVPSLGCTRCYKCKELGHTAKNCNYVSSIFSSAANGISKSVVPTSNMGSASFPHEIQGSMGVKTGIAQSFEEKKEDEGTSLQTVNPTIMNPSDLNVSNCSLQIVNPSNSGVLGTTSMAHLQTEFFSKAISDACANINVAYFPAAFNIGAKGTESYASRYQESLKVYPEAQIVWQ